MLKTHYGKVVAIHNEQVIAVGDERRPVIDEARRIAGYVDMYIEQVLTERPLERLGTRRVVGRRIAEKRPVEYLKGLREIGPVTPTTPEEEADTPQVVDSTPVQ